MSEDTPQPSVPPPVDGLHRFVWLGFGWFFFGVGLLGAFLPVLPTTPFMILALWAFSNSSERLRHWLYTHRIFGPSLQRWHEHRVIPAGAKLASTGAMAASVAYLLFFTDLAWPWLAITATLMAYGAFYILTKPSRVPVKPAKPETHA
jgi:uncharacterized membrane protein YbaN (DUF454 family)